MFMLEIEHREADIKILRFGRHIMRTSIGTRPSEFDKINDDAGAKTRTHDETANAGHGDEV